MFTTLRALLFGRHLANKLIKNNPGKTMVFTYESIGDQCMELAYCNEYKKKNHIKHLAIVTSNPGHPLFSFFKNEYDSLIKISKKNYLTLLKFYKSDFGQLYRNKHPELKCVFYTAYVRSDLLFRNDYVDLSDIEKMIYRLPSSTVPAKITRIDNDRWLDTEIKKLYLIKNKTVILNPYANSCSGVPLSFFERLTESLQNADYKVITGIHGDQKPIKGTEGIDFTLDKTLTLVEYCSYVIGLRSGFLDLCCFGKAKVVAIDHDSYRLSGSTKIEKWWPQNKNVITFTYNVNEDDLIDAIIKFIEKDFIL